jgi:hypothetical protein
MQAKQVEFIDARRGSSRRALLAGSLKLAGAGAVTVALTGYAGVGRLASAQDDVITLQGSIAGVSAQPGQASVTAALADGFATSNAAARVNAAAASAAGDSDEGAAAIGAAAEAVASSEDDQGAARAAAPSPGGDGGMRRIRLTRGATGAAAPTAAAPEVAALPTSGTGSNPHQTGALALLAAAAASMAGVLLTNVKREHETLEG